MPRHSNKPALSTKNTKALLQSIQETREATQEIKAELLEHNSVIKLHADHNHGPHSDAQEKHDEKQSFTGSNLKQANPSPHSGWAEGSPKTGAATEHSPKSGTDSEYAASKLKESAKEADKKDERNFNGNNPQRRVETNSTPKPSDKSSQSADGASTQKSGFPTFSLQHNLEQWMELNSTFSRMFFDNLTAAFRRPDAQEKE